MATSVDEGGAGMTKSSTREIKSPGPALTTLPSGVAELAGPESEPASLTDHWGGPRLTDYPPRTVRKMRAVGAGPSHLAPFQTLVWEADRYGTTGQPPSWVSPSESWPEPEEKP